MQHEQQLLLQVTAFDKLYVKEQPIPTAVTEGDPEAQPTSPMTDALEMPENIKTKC